MCVAVLGRNQTLLSCIFWSHYCAKSAKTQNFGLGCVNVVSNHEFTHCVCALRRVVGVYTAFTGQFWSRRSLESVQQRYSRLGRCGLRLLGHTARALIWAVARVRRCHPRASSMSCILVQTCGLMWASMGAQSLLGSRVKFLCKRIALTYYAQNCSYANTCLLCFKLCQHNVRMSTC